ncbi:MAG: NAD(P)/FAD-dependent oxidoreductase [Acidocella sp.]|nr:NAD(P)/FAD-dependent oxidoreductase [Acidocella sp.]MDR3717887.1 NAD(P)/FAD-dependent oxidoreductase [Bryobacteraceae bacterium]
MSVEKVETLVIGAGQAGIAMSEHLGKRGVPHLVVERKRIAERWRSERWDSLVANGPAWHDRFPNKLFDKTEPDGFAPASQIVDYLVEYAEQVKAPVRTGVEITSLRKEGEVFIAETADGVIEAKNVVTATGPFQKPVIPPVVPADAGIAQIHSANYHNPAQLPEGAVLVIGAGSSGVQIADELRRAGRKVYLSVGPHDRPPRRYRGKDFVWWLGALGQWNIEALQPGLEHVTIAVSGARGGHTVDFRELAASGITLVGLTQNYQDGVLSFSGDLEKNIAAGDANYLGMLQAADAYIAREGLDFPEEPEAHHLGPMPACATDPLLTLDLAEAGVTSIVWATGYALDFSWIKLDIFEPNGRPRHKRGVSEVPGLYFLGLAWLSRRASPFIWGVWHDADYLAEQIAARS